MVNGWLDAKDGQGSIVRTNHSWLEYKGWVADWAARMERYYPCERYYKAFDVVVRKRWTLTDALGLVRDHGYIDFAEGMRTEDAV